MTANHQSSKKKKFPLFFCSTSWQHNHKLTMTTELICGKKGDTKLCCKHCSYRYCMWKSEASGHPDGISIGSAIFARLTSVPNTQTHICSSTPQSVFCYAWQNRQHQVKLFCISLNAFVHAEYTGLYVQLKLMSYKERSVDLNRTSVNSKLNVLKVQ